MFSSGLVTAMSVFCLNDVDFARLGSPVAEIPDQIIDLLFVGLQFRRPLAVTGRHDARPPGIQDSSHFDVPRWIQQE